MFTQIKILINAYLFSAYKCASYNFCDTFIMRYQKSDC